MEKPLEPSKEDCCNSGCNPCIFDIYEKQLKLYEKYLADGEYNAYKGNSKDNGISQLEYTQFIIVKKIKICEAHTLIKFKKTTLDNRKVLWKAGDHFLFKYTSNEISCTRAYTPFVNTNELKDSCDFAIIVKKYDQGLVSSFLYNLAEECTTLWRGPYGHYELEQNKYDKIIMIAQGTGITAFIGIIDNILNNEFDITKVLLFYCCKCIDTILFRDELYAYKSYWNFKYELYVNSSDTNLKMRYQEPVITKKLSVEDILMHLTSSGNYQFLVCGSQKFNESFDMNIKKEIPSIHNIVLF